MVRSGGRRVNPPGVSCRGAVAAGAKRVARVAVCTIGPRGVPVYLQLAIGSGILLPDGHGCWEPIDGKLAGFGSLLSAGRYCRISRLRFLPSRKHGLQLVHVALHLGNRGGDFFHGASFRQERILADPDRLTLAELFRDRARFGAETAN